MNLGIYKIKNIKNGKFYIKIMSKRYSRCLVPFIKDGISDALLGFVK